MGQKFIPRVHTDEALEENTEIKLSKDMAHYLRTVLRLDMGSGVFIFNGEYGEFEAKITALSKSGAVVLVGTKIRSAYTPPPLILIAAAIDKDRFRWIIEKGTELGVTHFRPALTVHTNASKIRVDKAKDHALEAVRQCERLDIPRIDQPEKLSAILKHWDKHTPLFYCAELGDGVPIHEAVENAPKNSRYAVLVGPEGGFSEEEHQFLVNLPYSVPISLGPRILRAETAVAAALSVIQAGRGDWHAHFDTMLEYEDSEEF